MLSPRVEIPALDIAEYASFEQYRRFWDESREVRRKRLDEEARLAALYAGKSLKGICYVCAGERQFALDAGQPPNWRESLTCNTCALRARIRAAIQLTESRFDLGHEKDVYLTEQATPLYRALRARYGRVTGSEYVDSALESGVITPDGMRHEDLTCLSFEANAFDIILAFEVFEHVPNFEAAFRECHRCLRPGGTLVFTVPFDSYSPTIITRAVVRDGGQIDHLLPPEYHGDPIRSAGFLCFYHYGWELLDILRDMGYAEARALSCWSRELCILGDAEFLIFTATKV